MKAWIAAGAAMLVLAACGRAPVAPLTDSSEWLGAQKAAKARASWASGATMPRAQAEDVDRFLSEQPGDLVAHKKLIAFFYAAGTRFYAPDVVIAQRRKQILWLMAKYPEDSLLGEQAGLLSPDGPPQIADAEGYAQAKKLWLTLVAKPDSPVAILGNAAALLSAADRPQAEKLLLDAMARDREGHWGARLGALYAAEIAGSDAAVAEDARQKVARAVDPELAAAAHRHAPADGSPAALAMGAEAAYLQGNEAGLEEAKKSATLVLRLAPKSANDPDRGTATYRASIVMGLVSLQEHNREEAVKFLADAAIAPPTEELAAGVPRLTYSLLGELLKQGERESVLKFLDGFSKTCVGGRKELAAAATLIRQGRKPAWYPAAEE